MNKIDPNAPAFPRINGTEANPNFPGNASVFSDPGLSIRAHFALQIMAGIALGYSDKTNAARDAVSSADALIAELNKTEGKG